MKSGRKLSNLIYFIPGIALLVVGAVSLFLNYNGNRIVVGTDDVIFIADDAAAQGSSAALAPTLAPIQINTAPAVSPTSPSQTTSPGSSIQSPADASTAAPLPTPAPAPPARIVLPSINLDAPVLTAANGKVVIEDQKYVSWKAPDSFSAGWQNDSAMLGMVGNTVLNGHSSYSKDGIKLLDGVFKNLVDLKPGDPLSMFSSAGVEYHYTIATKVLLKERWQPVEIRLQNSSWMLPSRDERITLVTCWPYGSNTHRLIVIALPIKPEQK